MLTEVAPTFVKGFTQSVIAALHSRGCRLTCGGVGHNQSRSDVDVDRRLIRILQSTHQLTDRAPADFLGSRIDADWSRIQAAKADIFIVAGDDGDISARLNAHLLEQWIAVNGCAIITDEQARGAWPRLNEAGDERFEGILNNSA